MLEAMPARLFSQWHAFYSEEPFGFEIQNMLSANVAMFVAASAGAKDVRLKKYMLRFRKAATQSTKHIMAIARSMARVVVRKDKNDGRTRSS